MNIINIKGELLNLSLYHYPAVSHCDMFCLSWQRKHTSEDKNCCCCCCCECDER